MQQLGIPSQRDLAARTKLPPSNVRNWLTGRSAPGMEALQVLSAQLNASPEWLLFGTGPMFRDQTPKQTTTGDLKLLKVVELNPDVPSIYRAASELEDAELADSIRGVIRILMSPDVDPKVKGKVVGYLAAIDPGEKKAGLPGAHDAPRLGSRAGRETDR